MRPLKYTLFDWDIFAKTLYGEARGEGYLGILSVAWVIRNRVEKDIGQDNKPDWWGEGISGVCLAKKQFSCWNTEDPNFSKLSSVSSLDPIYLLCRSIAGLVICGAVFDPTRNSTHYHTRDIRPSWSLKMEKRFEIGRHIFYFEK